MMTMFRNLTTYLLGAGDNEDGSDPNTAPSPPDHSPNPHQEVDNEDDWVFVDDGEEEASGPAAVVEPVKEHQDDRPDEECGNVIEWENRLIEHPSMSVYVKSFECFETELNAPKEVGITEEAEPEGDTGRTLACSSPTGKQKRSKAPKNGGRHHVTDYLVSNKKLILQEMNGRNGGGHSFPVPQKRDHEVQAAASSRRNKYKNVNKLARVNNDRKCGCKKFM